MRLGKNQIVALMNVYWYTAILISFSYIFAGSICRSEVISARMPSTGVSDLSVNQQECPPQATQQVWLVNTRNLGCVSNRYGRHQDFSIHRVVVGTTLCSSFDDFSASLTPETVVCVFIDGNRIDPASAIDRGLNMSCKVNSSIDTRFVIWSWPSDKIVGPVRDARIKSDRSDFETYYLGSWLSQLPKNQRVSLIGYSLGGRIVTGALHLLAGGCVLGNSLGLDPSASPRPRSVLIGAAVPGDWLAVGRREGLAFSQSNATLSIYNSRDVTLRVFRLAMRRKTEHVVGYRPISLGCVNCAHFRQCDVANSVGTSHKLHDYVNSGTLGLIRAYALWEPLH